MYLQEFEEQLETIIKDYFDGFFDKITFNHSNIMDHHLFGFVGYRNGLKFGDVTPVRNWQVLYEQSMLFHTLEDIKGEFLRSENKIILENKKAAN